MTFVTTNVGIVDVLAIKVETPSSYNGSTAAIVGRPTIEPAPPAPPQPPPEARRRAFTLPRYGALSLG